MSQYIPCTTNALAVESMLTESGRITISDLNSQHIIGWMVDRYGGGNPTGIPVTVDEITDVYAVYFPDSEKWVTPGGFSGEGLESLAEYFDSRIND